MLAVLVVPCLSAQTGSEQDRRLAELEKKVRQLEGRIEELLAARGAVAPSAEPKPPAAKPDVAPLQPISVTGDYHSSGEGETRLPVAGYMEAHFNKDRGESGRADFHRFVLLFGHSFSERIKFWSELEVEHALVEGGEEKGEVALEQAYLDFLVKPWLNFRGGLMLSPVGIVNERHEPPAFNGVERPFVETTIIPTTWREIGAGITGDLGKGMRYRAYMISALDPTGFSAEDGIRNGTTGAFNAPFRNPAAVARFEYSGIRKLTWGVSGYTGVSSSEFIRVTPRVSIFSFDGRYSRGRFDLRGLFANTWISRTRDLNSTLERLTGLNPNVARQSIGYYIEPALHLFPRRLRSDLIAFTRYEKYNTQHRMAPGFQALPEFNRSSWVTGVTFKPNADVAVKFDYVLNRSASTVFRQRDAINLGLGWWF